MKKLLAILCTVAILFGSVFTGMAVSAEETAIEMPELTDLTVANLDYIEGTGINVGYTVTFMKNATSFANTSFKAVVKTDNASKFRFATTGEGGIGINFQNNGAYLCKNFNTGTTYAKVDGDFRYKYFKLQVDIGVIDIDSDGEDDVRFNVYFDDALVMTADVADTAASNWVRIIREDIAFYSVESYNGTVQPVDELDKLDKILPSEMGFRNGTHNKPASAPYTADDMGFTYSGDIYNKMFDIDVNFKSTGYMRYPMSSTESGFELKADGANLLIRDWYVDSGIVINSETGETVSKEGGVIATITPDMVDGTPLTYNDINIKVYLEKGNFDDDCTILDENTGDTLFSVENDVRVTYYINNKAVWTHEFGGSSEVETTVDETTGQTVYNVISTTGGTALFDAKNKMLAIDGTFNDATVDMPKLEKEYTPETWGVGYKKFTAAAGGPGYRFNIDETFNTDIIIHEDAQTGTYVLHLNNLGAINIGSDGTLSYVDYLGLGNARKLTTYDVRGKQMNLKLTLQSAVFDEDGLANDIVLGIWLDNKLCGNKYIYIKDMNFTVSGYPTIAAGVEFIKPTAIDADLTEVIPEDAGFKSGTYNLLNDATLGGQYYNHNSATNIKYAIDTVFTTYITVEEVVSESGSLWLYYGSLDDLCLKIFADNTAGFYWGNNNAFVTGVALPEVGTEFKYQVTIEDAEADLNMDGIYNDVRIGAWINGELMGGKYYYFAKGNSRLTTYHDSTATNAFVYWYNPNATLDATVTFRSDARELSADYTVVTPADYHTGINGKYYRNTETNHPIPISYWPLKGGKQPMAGKVFSAYISAKGGSNNWLAFGQTDSAGIRINLGATSASVGCHIGGTVSGKTTLPDFKPETIQKWDITFDYKGNDLYIGFYIDGVLQNNSYLIIKGGDYSNLYMFGYYCNNADCWTYFGSGVGAENGYNVIAKDIDNEEYALAPTDTTTITVDGVAVTAETTLAEFVADNYENVLGDFTVVTTTVAIETTSVVALYIVNDLTLDEQVNILDFIVMQKNAAGQDFDTYAAAAAAGKADKADICTPADLIALKKVLLGIA